MTRALIVIPTYNEADNISKLIPRVLVQSDAFDVLVVDDRSPDGTARVVQGLQGDGALRGRVHMIEREEKKGLGTAYVAGFKYALEHGYEHVFEMDADFSHDPIELPILYHTAQEYDVAIGSRYISGVNVVNWPMRRLILSYAANVYTRFITGMPVRDATSGFTCIRRRVLEAIDLDAISSNGYAFQIEMKFKAWKRGFRLHEMPIVFVDRRDGISKMSKSIMYEAALMVWKLKLKSLIDGR
jgi:dolichol-phosphate mannosyltransferase